MSRSDDELRTILERSAGKCHLCHKRLSFKNYGQRGARGAWQVDHSRPKSRGGTNHGANLRAACIPCNEGKSDQSSRAYRRGIGVAKPPLSRHGEEAARTRNGFTGVGIGAIAGGLLAGPPGVLIGGLLGGAIGNGINPNEDE